MGEKWFKEINNEMDSPQRLASHLPTIKCSDCGRDIDFSSIANHVCSAVLAGMCLPSTSIDALLLTVSQTTL